MAMTHKKNRGRDIFKFSNTVRVYINGEFYKELKHCDYILFRESAKLERRNIVIEGYQS